MKQILKEIANERKRQTKLYGVQNHDKGYWLSILGEEFGEVCRAVCDHDDKNYREELIHVAAVAVQMIECYDRNKSSN